MQKRKAAYFVVEYKDKDKGFRAIKSATELGITQMDMLDTENMDWNKFLNTSSPEVPYTLVAINIFEVPEATSLEEASEILGGPARVLEALNKEICRNKFMEIRTMLRRDYVHY